MEKIYRLDLRLSQEQEDRLQQLMKKKDVSRVAIGLQALKEMYDRECAPKGKK